MLLLSIESMNDAVGPEALVPSLPVFDLIPSLPDIKKPLPEQRDRMAALSMARAEMSTIAAELRISQAIRYNIPPAIHFKFRPGDDVRVYNEKERRWCGPFKIMRLSGREVVVTNGIKTPTYGTSQVLPSVAVTHDRDLRKLLSGMKNHTEGYVQGYF